VALFACCAVSVASGQGTSSAPSGVPTEPRTVSGRLFLGTRKAQLPLADRWVTLHRIDLKSGGNGSGPVDSVRTSADGRYAFHYAGVMSDSVVYFVLTTYGGVAYPTPLRDAHVSGADAEITVFDTTSAGAVPIHVKGRHLIVTAPREGRMRTVVEVFDLSNDSTVTITPRVVGRDSQPVWTTHLPVGATDVRVNPEGIEGTASQRGDELAIVSPLSPGLRQVSFSYTLAPDHFPLTIPLQRPTELLEVLIQEPTATLDGPGITEVAAVSPGGETFRRFLSQDLPADGVLHITVPAPGESAGTKVIRIVAAVLGGLMLLSILVAFGRPQRVVPPRMVDPIDTMLRELATLDGAFERGGAHTADARAAYERGRAAIKARLVAALSRTPNQA
jgi:hypothetical protein